MSLECCNPLKMYYNQKKQKYQINYNKDCRVKYILVDCGRCPHCNEKYKMQLGTRGRHELMYHPSAMFITLTVADENIEKVFGKNRELKHYEFQKFIKRLRKFMSNKEEYKDIKIKYLMCGEYGEKGGRPHYHAVIYGLRFNDCKIWKRGKNPLYRSKQLEKLWKYGYSSIGNVTFQSIQYLGKYVCKAREEGAEDILDLETGEFRKKKKPYIIYPRGFGLSYMVEHRKEIFTRGYFQLPSGGKIGIPRYYKKKLEEMFEEEYLDYRERAEKFILEKEKQKELIYETQEEYYEFRMKQGKIIRNKYKSKRGLKLD